MSSFFRELKRRNVVRMAGSLLTGAQCRTVAANSEGIGGELDSE